MKPPRPYYVPVANEEHVFKAAFRQGLSIALKGPTGCGKTRFVEAMATAVSPKIVLTVNHASGAGYYAMAGAPYDPVVQLSPPLICGQEEIDFMASTLREVLTEAWRRL